MDMSTSTPTLNSETLYSNVEDHAALVRRVGLREALAVLDPKLRERESASAAVLGLNRLAEQHRRNYSSGAELNHAEFMRGETRDAAAALRIQVL